VSGMTRNGRSPIAGDDEPDRLESVLIRSIGVGRLLLSPAEGWDRRWGATRHAGAPPLRVAAGTASSCADRRRPGMHELVSRG
jgi:hypothetical protein